MSNKGQRPPGQPVLYALTELQPLGSPLSSLQWTLRRPMCYRIFSGFRKKAGILKRKRPVRGPGHLHREPYQAMA
jgi:hypothetical protein